MRNRIIESLIIGIVGGWLIAVVLVEIAWLLSPAGGWFNTDTIPLQVELWLLVVPLFSPWTYLLMGVASMFAFVLEPLSWDWSV